MEEDCNVDAAFEAALFCEERELERAYDQGLQAANGTGSTEGYHLGYHKGAHFGYQIGYYLGIVSHHLALHSKNSELYNNRVTKQLYKVKELCEQFPKANVEEDLNNLIANIQAHYRKLCSLLKIEVFHPDSKFVTF